MNKAHIKKLIAIFRGEKQLKDNRKPVLFDMDYFVMPQKCGTVACIAGHAAILSKEKISEEKGGADIDYLLACDWLGIEPEVGEQMFYHFTISDTDDYIIRATTALDAANMLEHFLATGQVVWATE